MAYWIHVHKDSPRLHDVPPGMMVDNAWNTNHYINNAIRTIQSLSNQIVNQPIIKLLNQPIINNRCGGTNHSNEGRTNQHQLNPHRRIWNVPPGMGQVRCKCWTNCQHRPPGGELATALAADLLRFLHQLIEKVLDQVDVQNSWNPRWLVLAFLHPLLSSLCIKFHGMPGRLVKLCLIPHDAGKRSAKLILKQSPTIV